MILLTRFNGETFRLNALLIEQIQSHPDTTITLVGGKKMVVLEQETEVVQKVIEFYQKIGLRVPVTKAGDDDGGFI